MRQHVTNNTDSSKKADIAIWNYNYMPLILENNNWVHVNGDKDKD